MAGSSSSGLGQLVFIGCVAALYIAISAGMICFNKWLMHTGRYPYSVALVTGHMATSSVSLGMLYLARPACFPSLEALRSNSRNQMQGTLKWFLLISVLFAAQLVLTNMAYLKSSVAFLQMMKEGNLVLVYAFSLLFSLDFFTPLKSVIIFGIISATTMTIRGELSFSMAGFSIQGTSQFMESSKLIIQSIVLSGQKFDPLSYVLLVSPVSLCLLSSFLAVISTVNDHNLLDVPSMAEVYHWSPYLLLNAVVALSLNVVMAIYIKHTSAIALILSGIVKDCVIVLSGHFFMGEPLSTMQEVGFSVQLTCIFLWSQVKARESEEAAKQKLLIEKQAAAETNYEAVYGSAPAADAAGRAHKRVSFPGP